MSDVGSVLGGVAFQLVGDVVGVILATEEYVLFFHGDDFQSGLFQHDNYLPLINLILFC